MVTPLHSAKCNTSVSPTRQAETADHGRNTREESRQCGLIRSPRRCAQEWPTPPTLPGTDHGNSGVREIADIARNDDLRVNHCGRRDQPVGHATRSLGPQSSPFERYAIRDRNDPVTMVLTQLLQPRRQSCSCTAVGLLFERDPLHDLAQRDDAEIDRGRIDRAQPGPSLPATAARLGKNAGIDEVHQTGTSRPGSPDLVLIASTTSSGHAAPFRIWSTIEGRDEVSRANSSSETTTTAGSPRTLTCCGPC